MSTTVLPPAMFELDAAEYVEREPRRRARSGDDLPAPMFDVDERGELKPPAFEPGEHAPKLTPYGAHHGLGPGIWANFPQLCGDAHYGSIEHAGRRVWIWHVCSSTDAGHDVHGCDRCGDTW